MKSSDRRTSRTAISTRLALLALFSVSLILSLLTASCDREPRTPQYTIVIRMMDIQAEWFRSHIVTGFEELHGLDLIVSTFDKIWDLERILDLEREAGKKRILLVKTPLEMTRVLQARGLILPYDDFVPPQELSSTLEEYNDLALKMGTIDGKIYFLPRKLETRMMVYDKSKITEAVENWTRFRDEIISCLREENGYGLPSDYELEANPNRWDYFDLFVAAYYWANTEYFNIKMPRMAHRGQRYGGTVQGLIDRAYQFGATQEQILAMNTQPIVDMFRWEAVFRKHGLYNPGMWQDPWSGGGIWNAMKDGKVFLAWMHQIDCFFIHGGSVPQMQGFLADPDDLGEAVMPLGVSVDLDDEGLPLRIGTRKASSGGWWWAVPSSCPDPMLAWKLARFITNRENHLAESQAFGMMPIRKDILGDLALAFPAQWMRDIFDTSGRQLELNGDATVPLIPQYAQVGKNYLDAWYELVIDQHYGQDGRIDPQHMRSLLDTKYVARQREILGERFPSPSKKSSTAP